MAKSQFRESQSFEFPAKMKFWVNMAVQPLCEENRLIDLEGYRYFAMKTLSAFLITYKFVLTM